MFKVRSIEKNRYAIIITFVVVFLIFSFLVFLKIPSNKVMGNMEEEYILTLKELIELDPEIELDNLVGIHDDILYLKEPFVNELKRYSIRTGNFFENLYFEETYDYLDYKIIRDKIIMVNHNKQTICIYDINGKLERTIYLESDCNIYSTTINSVPVVLDGEYIYVANKFLEGDNFMNVQKYNMNSELVSDIRDSRPFHQLIDYKNYIIAVYINTLCIFNKNLEKKIYFI